MTTTAPHPTDPVRVLASGRLVHVDADGKAELWTCGWIVQRWAEPHTCPETGDTWAPEEPDHVECGAPVHDVPGPGRRPGDGWACAAGHGYVAMETRHRERWDYAEDRAEADNLAAHGITPVLVGSAP